MSDLKNMISPLNEDELINVIIKGFSQLNYAPDHIRTEQAHRVMMDVFEKLNVPFEKVVKRLLENDREDIVENIFEYTEEEKKKIIEKIRKDLEKEREKLKKIEEETNIARMFLEEHKDTDIKDIYEEKYFTCLNILEDRDNLEENLKNYIVSESQLRYLIQVVCKKEDCDALFFLVKYIFLEPIVPKDMVETYKELIAVNIRDKISFEIVKKYIEPRWHVYVQIGDLKKVKELRQDGKISDTSIYIAIAYGHVDVVEYLLETYMYDQNRINNFYCVAIATNNRKLINLFHRIGINPDERYYNRLAAAYIEVGDIGKFSKLKDKVNLINLCEEIHTYFPEIPEPAIVPTQMKMFEMIKSWVREKYNL